MKGIDVDHPQVWTADYGKGRAFSVTLGHGEVSLHFQPLQTLTWADFVARLKLAV